MAARIAVALVQRHLRAVLGGAEPAADPDLVGRQRHPLVIAKRDPLARGRYQFSWHGDYPHFRDMPVNPPGAIELQHYALVPPVTTFALPAAGTNNTTLGVRTGAGCYVLKRYAVPHGAAGLRYQHELLTWLQGRGLTFALPAPVATVAGATWLHDGARYCALLPLLAGKRPDHGNPAHMERSVLPSASCTARCARIPRRRAPACRDSAIWPPFTPAFRIPKRSPRPTSVGGPAGRRRTSAPGGVPSTGRRADSSTRSGRCCRGR